MAASCTKKFRIQDGDEIKLYRPGNLITDPKIAKWAVDNDHGKPVADAPAEKAAKPAANKAAKPKKNK